MRFYGNQAEGFRALAVAMQAQLPVTGLRRVWPVLDNEPTGPWWELTFTNPPPLFDPPRPPAAPR